FQAAGIKVFCVVPSPRLAKKMEDNGADGVVVEGWESPWYLGKNTTFSLVSQSRSKIKEIPLVAAGGIYDGKTAGAAFLLGADGIQMGTRFLASKEAKIPEDYKKKILFSQPDDLEVILSFTGYPIRVIKNEFSQEMEKLEKEGAFPEEIKPEKIAGNLDFENLEKIPLLAGLSVGGINEIKSCKEIIEEVYLGAIKEIEELYKKIKEN
ncbi:MAG: NAD(P)H-dependent flavin oxidoreductase, partial [Minisyncoccales bacterium]